MLMSMRHLGVIVASSFNYVGACLLILIWKMDIFIYLPIAFAISCMIGLLVVEIERSIIYTIACVIMGHAMAAAILLSPHTIFQASVGEFNIAGTVVLGSIGKLFLVSAAAYFLGVIFGCFLGEKTTSLTEK